MTKVIKMNDAISRFMRSGEVLFLSGTQHGSPTAALVEVIRQKIDHLTVVSVLSTANNQIGEGLVDKLITGYNFLNKK
jgi:acyl CoA:acetate/3-ketoacid CoA transferase alpha subunit